MPQPTDVAADEADIWRTEELAFPKFPVPLRGQAVGNQKRARLSALRLQFPRKPGDGGPIAQRRQFYATPSAEPDLFGVRV